MQATVIIVELDKDGVEDDVRAVEEVAEGGVGVDALRCGGEVVGTRGVCGHELAQTLGEGDEVLHAGFEVEIETVDDGGVEGAVDGGLAFLLGGEEVETGGGGAVRVDDGDGGGGTVGGGDVGWGMVGGGAVGVDDGDGMVGVGSVGPVGGPVAVGCGECGGTWRAFGVVWVMGWESGGRDCGRFVRRGR